ncbi:hypothetical protein ACET3Z_022025 [Daucus carota]
MAQLSANSTQFNFQKPTYCRKEKSLDLLCSNFLNLYDQDRGEMIETHDACARLGVDKRRLRDFIVILESIGLLKKERKNHYSWKGFGVLPKTFQLLQRGGLGESYTRLEDDEASQVVEDGRGGKLDNRKENCIELLTQKFVKLFLCSELELISIDEAAILLNGDAQDPSLIQTKVKRLYDIANVLASMNIIQKTYQPETKRFVFRWIGIRREAEMATTNDLALKTKRRTIENEATDTSAKRHMGDQSSKGTTSQTVVAPSQTPCEGRSPKKVVENDLEKGSIPDIEKHRFGPFAPTTVRLKTNPKARIILEHRSRIGRVLPKLTVLNIISTKLLKKERKNHYSWKGFGVLPKTFQLLQRGGLGESYTRLEDDEVSQVGRCILRPVVTVPLDSSSSASSRQGSPVSSLGGKLDNRKENCLELLTQKFVKLFLCSELELISVDEAANILNGDAQDPSLIQTKVKRLYDIANVLASMNIIEKTYQPETKRFVFRWIGMRGEAEMATINDLVLKNKRRTIENEPTSTSAKRHMGDQSSKGTTSQTVVAPSQTPCESRSPKKVVENDLEKGPITTVPQDKPQGKNNGTQIQDWESLALTHRPQYHQHQGTASFFDE